MRDYNAWTAAEKADLSNAYWKLEEQIPLGLADPPPNALNPADDVYPSTALTIDHAWPLFVAFAANSLHAEIRNRVSWRIADAAPEILNRLLDSRSLFTRNASGQYVVSPYNPQFGNGGFILPSPPDLIRKFLSDNALIGADRLETIARVLEWCRQNLAHFFGSYQTGNVEEHWQYRGLPPVSRIISGTVLTGSASALFPGPMHWTGGCHGTNGFLSAILRVANVPVDYARAPDTGHATPWFFWDSRYLSHGDDPYNALTRSTPPYPASDLLIDPALYAQWFGVETTTAQERNDNVGRQVRELALIHLPNYLLHAHCNDLAAGRGHNASDVAGIFSRNYTVAELEALNLWTRLDAKVAALGGCAHVP